MYFMSQLMGYTIGSKLGEMEYYLAGQIVGDKISSVAGGLIQAAGKTISDFGTALDLYLLFNGIGGGSSVGQIVGGGSAVIEGAATVGGLGTIAGTAIGGAISAFGEKLKENAESEGVFHEEQLEEILKEFKEGYGSKLEISDQKMYQLGDHFNKHGREMGYASKKEYEEGARAFIEENKNTAEIYEGKWNSSRGVQGGETQIIIRADGKQAIINKTTGQIIDFYEGTSLNGFIDIRKVQ